jgi:hypothetical protein
MIQSSIPTNSKGELSMATTAMALEVEGQQPMKKKRVRLIREDYRKMTDLQLVERIPRSDLACKEIERRIDAQIAEQAQEKICTKSFQSTTEQQPSAY